MLRAFAEVRSSCRRPCCGSTASPGRAGAYARRCRELARLIARTSGTRVFEDSTALPVDVHRRPVLVFSGTSGAAPRLVAEAMLSGRPVVATDTGAAREVVGPGGLLVPAEDPRALAAACLALLSDSDRRFRLGNAGRLRPRSSTRSSPPPPPSAACTWSWSPDGRGPAPDGPAVSPPRSPGSPSAGPRTTGSRPTRRAPAPAQFRWKRARDDRRSRARPARTTSDLLRGGGASTGDRRRTGGRGRRPRHGRALPAQ
ncbi:glycosyltransferase [Streptacidiphilus sp. 4-A2]|nr:glycosyltransferase [Streptacidiphilus sp. 4-A2]